MAAPYHVYLFFLLAGLAAIKETQGVEFAIVNYAIRTSGGVIFDSKLSSNAVNVMDLAMTHIWQLFGQSKSPDYEKRVKVKKIVLCIKDRTMEKRSSTFELQNQIGRININADYIANCSEPAAQLGSDFLDRIYYEMTHILQWNANGEIPPAIRDGIAAYVVFDVGTGEPRGWVKPGEGNSWDESPDVTGRFFQYITDDLYCSNFVWRLNEKMKDSYDDSYFVELTKKTISEAWKEYMRKYGKHVW